MCMYGFLSESVFHVKAGTQRGQRGHRIPCSWGVISDYELLCGCWEQNPDHLQMQYMLLTTEHLSSPWK